MTTPAEKDAMALAVLDRAASCVRTLYDRPDAAAYADRAAKEYTDAKDYLTARVASLEQGWKAEIERSTAAVAREVAANDRATRAAAELAAVRANAERYVWLREANNADQTPFIAQRYEYGIMQWTGEKADAAVDAARGAG